MMKQVSSRNQRSKGLRMKNVLQLCLLAAVCFWLLYQLKHSYNKKRALEERNLKGSEKIVKSQFEFLKLGRKDLSRSAENSSGNGIHDKEEGNEEVEEEEDDREIKQAMEDEEAGGDGDDEIDEQDQERDDEQDQERDDEREDQERDDEREDQERDDEREDQERVDEEAENGEELTNEEDKDDQGEETEPLDDQDPEEDSSHRAREETYKRDDVSSAVRRESQEKNSDDEDGDAGEEVMENTEVKYVDADDTADGADDASKTNSDLSVGAADISKDNIMGVVLEGSKTNRDDYPIMNGTVIEKKRSKFGFNNSEGSPGSNQREPQAHPTTAYVTNNHVEAQANSTSAVSNNQTETQTSSTVSDVVADSVPLWNETFSRDSFQKHSIMVEMENSERNKINLKNVVMEGLAERSNTTVGQEDGADHSSVSLSTRNIEDPIQDEFTESSHKMVTEEERDARIDLSTLPALQNEAKSMADEATE